VLALLDAEAGEPEPYDPPEDWRETPNRDGSLAPPPSDARERLALALNHLAFPCSAGTPQEAADAILAAHREELEPLAENLNATAINAKEALDQVAALTARMADLEREMRDLWQPAAPSGDVAQDHGDTEAARHVVEIPSSPEGAASVQPSPASAWPSDVAWKAAHIAEMRDEAEQQSRRMEQAVREALAAPCGKHRGESLRECPECLPERIAAAIRSQRLQLRQLAESPRRFAETQFDYAALAALRGTP
jgi:hypothetical protein